MRFQELVLEDFKPIQLENNQFYLSARRGMFEITLEEHLVVGFTIGIYEAGKRFLALEKRTFYYKNHPAGYVPDDLPGKLIIRTLEYANQLLEKYEEVGPENFESIRRGQYVSRQKV